MSWIRLALTCCSVLLIAGCGGADRTTVARARSDTAAPSPASAAAAGGVLVDVSGLVRRPGVYRLPAGARVHEAIAAAGGVRRGADLASLNRAATLVDGQQVVVADIAVQAAGGAEAGGVGGGGGGSGQAISINAADAAALDALPGIGPVTAERIVSEREQGGPFATLDDLDRVSGIGPATIEALRDVART